MPSTMSLRVKFVPRGWTLVQLDEHWVLVDDAVSGRWEGCSYGAYAAARSAGVRVVAAGTPAQAVPVGICTGTTGLPPTGLAETTLTPTAARGRRNFIFS